MKQTGEVQIKIRDNHGKPFIAKLYDILFASDLCNQLFSITVLMNLGYNFLFHKGFFKVVFSVNEHNMMTLTHSGQ